MTVVLLHPLPLDGSIWSHEIRALGSSTIAPTLYALGDSIEDWAAGVLELCGDGPLVLVGNSIGGSCALEIARLEPARVQLLVLVGAKPGHRPEPEFRDEALSVLEQEGLDAAWLRYWLPLFAPHADPKMLERARVLALSQGLIAIMNGVRVFHSRPDRTAFAKTLNVPVVVVSGDQDTAPRHSAALAAPFPRAEFHRVDGCGHYVPLEQPALLATTIRAAMAQLPSYP